MVSWKRFLYLLIRPLTLRKSSCSKASRTSSTLSHILASSWPERSPRVSARYGSPVFLGFTCFDTTTNVDVMTLFSCCAHSEIKKSFMGSTGFACTHRLQVMLQEQLQAIPRTASAFSFS